MLVLKNIVKDYSLGQKDKLRALKNINISFEKSGFVSILGPSGCGKTTLLNIIGGLDQYTSGDLIIDGISTKDYKDKNWDLYRNNKIGFVFQNYNLIPHLSILENVMIPLSLNGENSQSRKEKAIKALKQVNLDENYKKKPNQLSGGQMRRVAIAGVLAMRPELLVLDEPAAGLDPQSREDMLSLISQLHKDGTAVVMVSHSMDDVARFATRAVVMEKGKVAMIGTPVEIFSRAEELEKMGLDVPGICRLGMVLREKGLAFPENIFKEEDAVQAILSLWKGEKHAE